MSHTQIDWDPLNPPEGELIGFFFAMTQPGGSNAVAPLELILHEMNTNSR